MGLPKVTFHEDGKLGRSNATSIKLYSVDSYDQQKKKISQILLHYLIQPYFSHFSKKNLNSKSKVFFSPKKILF